MPDRRPKEHFVPLCLRVSQTSAAREARTRPAGLHHPRSKSFVFRTPSGARNPRASAAGALAGVLWTAAPSASLPRLRGLRPRTLPGHRPVQPLIHLRLGSFVAEPAYPSPLGRRMAELGAPAPSGDWMRGWPRHWSGRVRRAAPQGRPAARSACARTSQRGCAAENKKLSRFARDAAASGRPEPAPSSLRPQVRRGCRRRDRGDPWCGFQWPCRRGLWWERASGSNW